MNKVVHCVRCGEQMQESILPRHFVGTYQSETVLCENVPVERCPNCGQIYFPARVAELFEKIRRGEITARHKTTLELGAYPMDELLLATQQ